MPLPSLSGKGFFASSAAFLYLGISMNIVDVGEHLPIIVISFVAVLAARAAAIICLLLCFYYCPTQFYQTQCKYILKMKGRYFAGVMDNDNLIS
jgi:NhaP-type Na+/H+ or K+/H+ antiporter